jgi:hypothetical protein
MAAPKRVSDETLLSALEARCWNIRATADDLGLQPKSVYKRLATLGISPQAARQAFLNSGSDSSRRHDLSKAAASHQSERVLSSVANVAKSGSVFFPKPPSRPILGGVSASAIRAARPLPTPRLRPDQLERLRDAKFDVHARLRSDVDETGLLREFFDDAFETWIASVLRLDAYSADRDRWVRDRDQRFWRS